MAKGDDGGGHGRLTYYIVGAIVLAVLLSLVGPAVLGQGFRPIVTIFDTGGEIFLRLLQMVVVPLVMASVMSGILGLGDVRKLGRPGAYAISYYLTTTVLAVATGLIVINVVMLVAGLAGQGAMGVTRELVEDSRKAGDEAVSHAGRGMDKKFEWHNVTGDRAADSQASRYMAVPEGRHVVRITIDQVGKAARPASVQVRYSTNGGDFLDLPEGKFTAAHKAGIYRTQPAIELPPEAKYAQLVYTAADGDGAESIVEAHLSPAAPSIGDIFKHLVLMLFTNNLLQSMVEINLLPLIIFSIVFAGMLTTLGQRATAIRDLVVSVNDALMNFILLLMKLAPLGIFCLVAARFSKAQLDGKFLALLGTQAWYMSTVLIGLACHALITLPLLLWIFTRRNPLQFFAQMSQALLTAFSTASSTATLPVTMECAEVRAGVSRRSTEFVLPLGATVNMDGTALYEAAAAIFIAQAYALIDPSFVLTFDKQVIIAVTATLAAIGAAGIPEAGLVTMLIVLNAVGLPLELIGLILPLDWLLDRFRTAVNAFGDSVGAAIVDRSFPAIAEA
ncbi:MAG: dicarboxylate/amino acid:cation symporter [Pirellulaceae bacterium]